VDLFGSALSPIVLKYIPFTLADGGDYSQNVAYNVRFFTSHIS
jgi:hypothetical protein